MNINKYGIGLDTTSSSFQLKQRQFVLTYSAKIPKEELVEWFSTNFYDLKHFGVCHETYTEDDEAGELRYHTHFLLHTTKQPNITDARKFDYIIDGIVYHPNIKKIFTKSHFDNWFHYFHKEDENPYTNITNGDLDKNVKVGELINTILAHTTFAHVLKDENIRYDIRRHLNWAKEVWKSKPPKKVICDIKYQELLFWQRYIYRHLKNEPIMRQIIWIWSDKPEQGKSTLMKYISNKYSVLKLDTFKLNDIAFIYNNENIVYFDLSWSKSKNLETNLLNYFKDNIPFNDGMFNTLENLSNQDILTSCKYEGKSSAFSSHIIVCSNCDPRYVSKYLPKRIYPVKATLNTSEDIPKGFALQLCEPTHITTNSEIILSSDDED
jgi:hypothetical protein